MLKRKRFKFVVTLVLLLTFVGTSIPLEGFVPQKAYAAEQGAFEDEANENVSFLEKILKTVSTLIKSVEKTAGAIKAFIEETIWPNVIPNAKDAPDIPDKTLNSKTQDLGDGKYKTTIHTEPIHFENEDGELEDIDNRAVETDKPGFAYENKANSFKIFFAENTISEKLVRIDFDKRLIEWKILDAAHSKISAKDNTITYKSVFKDVDLKYTIENTKLKEELILSSSKAPSAYKFRLNLKNVYYKKEADGSIGFYDLTTKEKVWVFEKPYMYDAKGIDSEEVTIDIKDIKGKIYLELVADEKWLESKDRKYPVTIDPTVWFQPNAAVGRDTFVSSRYPNSNYYARDYLKAGYDSTHHNTISYLYFSDIDNLPHGSKVYVDSAYLSVYGYGGFDGWVDLHEVSQSWTSGGVTYNNRPGHYGQIEANSYYAYGWADFNITNLMKNWLNRGHANYGMAIVGAGGGRRYYSSDSGDWFWGRPGIEVTYEVDTTAPWLNVTYPANGQIVSGTSYIEAYADDNIGVSKVEYLIDGKLIGTGGWGFSDIDWNTKKYSDGNHTAAVKAYDFVGNVATVNRTVKVDNGLPSVSIKSPSSNAVLSGSVPININASDSVSGIYCVDIYIGGYYETTLYGSSSSYTWNTTEYEAGEYTIVAEAFDKAGNSKKSSPVKVRLDHESPSVQIAEPWDGDHVSGDILVEFDTLDDFGITQARFYVDGALKDTKDFKWFYNPWELFTDKFALDTTSLSDGGHTLKVTVRDLYGRESSSTISVTVDNTLPSGGIVRPTDGAILRGVVPVEVSAEDSTSPIDKVEYYVDGGLTETIYEAPYVYDLDTGDFADGSHTLLVKIYDKAGNAISRQITVTVDNTAPTAFIASPSDGEVVKGILSISATAGDNYELDKINLYVERFGGGYESAFETDTASSIIRTSWQGSFALDTTRIKDGEYTLLLESIDKAGNSQVASINVKVKNTPSELGVKGFWPYHIQDMPYFAAWINARNGNLTLKRTDLSVPGISLPTTLDRVYNNQSGSVGDTGYGWLSNTGAYLSEYESGDIELLDATGTKLYFKKNGDGTYSAPAGIYSTLTKTKGPADTPSAYTLTYQNKTKDIFDYAGNLVETVDLSGNSIFYERDANGRLTTIIDDAGRTYSVSYNERGLIERVTDPAGQTIAYAFDEASNLTKVTDQAANQATFAYDENHNLIAFTDGTVDDSGTANTARFTYDGEGRVVAYIDPLGNKTTYTYDAQNRQMIVTDPLGNKTTYTYGENGNLVSAVDPLGSTTSYEFDSSNNLIATIDANGGKVSYVYDEAGNVIKTIDTMGRETEYAYDINNNITSVVYPDNTEAKYAYDEKGNLIKETDPLGKIATYTYDEYGNPISATDELGQVTSYTFDELGNMTSVTDPKGSTTEFDYDILGQVTAVQDPLGNTTEYTYDALGNRTSVTDASGETATFEYDAAGRLTKTVDPLGAETAIEYDGNGNAVAAVDPQGNETTFEYDAAGNQVATTDALGNTTTYGYDAAGNLTKTIDPEGRVESFAYDALGQIESATTPEGATTAFNYDSEGNVTSVVDGNGGVTSYAYDENNQVTQVKDPLGYIATWDYDAMGSVTKTTDFGGEPSSFAYNALGNITTVTDASGATSSYEYDESGNLVAITDATGEKMTYSYDALGRVVSEADPLGNKTSFEYDGVGRLVSQTDAMGFSSEYEYDANGNLIKETDAYGDSTNFVYDELGNLSQETDPLGNTTKYTYDANGALLSETDGEGNTQKYAYSPSGDLVAETDTNGNTTNYSYDSQGNVTAETDPLGNTSKYTYDAMGNLTSETDPLGNTTKYEFDLGGNLGKEVDPLGAIYKYTYSAMGEITSETDPLGATVKYEYDQNGNISKEVDQLGNETSYAYDPLGNLLKETDPLGRILSYEYDEAGNLVAETDGAGSTTRYTYDANGNVKQEIDPEGNIVNYSFDANDNLTSIVDELGSSTTYTYDGNGNIVAETDAEGLVTRYSYDANDNLTSVTDPEGSITKYTYDGEDNLISTTDPLGNTTTYTYDANDNLESVVDPAGNTTTYTYDPNGNITSVTNANGATTTYSYDAAGRLEEIVYPSGKTVEYDYNLAGDMVSKTDSSGVTTYTYDATGRVTTQTSPDGTTVEYTYNAVGDITEKKVNGESTGFSFDERGNISSITDKDGNTTYFTYDRAGNRTSIKYPNGTTITMEYDKAGRLTKVATTNSAGETLSTTTYVYDRNGNRVEIVTEAGVHRYSYDRSGQLVEASYPDGRAVKYAYDKAGNRLSLEVSVAFGGVESTGNKKGIEEIIQDISTGNKVQGNKEGLRETIQAVLLGTYTEGEKNGIRQIILDSVNGYTVTVAAYEYNNANQLTKVAYPVLDVSYALSYDKSGNMLSDGVKTYAYDSENRLVSIKEKTKTITYTYDDRGYRTSTSVNGKKSVYHYEGDLVAYETDADGNTTKKYSYDDKGRPISFTYSGATYYYIADGHGDVVGLTDASGVKVVSYSYDAFGNLSSIEGDKGLAKANPYRYAGYRYDDEAAMYYLISRYYDPMLARFISKDTEAIDPLEPVTLNLYTYGGNNPVNNIDPDGKSFLSLIKKKASRLLGYKESLSRSFDKLKKATNAKVSNALHRAVSSFSRTKVAVVNIGKKASSAAQKTVKIVKYGKNKVKAYVRGEKARVLQSYNRAKGAVSRVKQKAVKRFNKELRKAKVTLKAVKRSASGFAKSILSKAGKASPFGKLIGGARGFFGAGGNPPSLPGGSGGGSGLYASSGSTSPTGKIERIGPYVPKKAKPGGFISYTKNGMASREHVSTVEYSPDQERPGDVFTIGINAGGYGYGFSASFDRLTTEKRNRDWFFTFGAGRYLGSPSVSVAADKGRSHATTKSSYTGWSTSITGEATYYGGVGGELIYFLNSQTGSFKPDVIKAGLRAGYPPGGGIGLYPSYTWDIGR